MKENVRTADRKPQMYTDDKGKRRVRMVRTDRNVVNAHEKIDMDKAEMGDVIKDFQKSDAPQFKGKSKEKRRQMAIAAKMGAKNESVQEDIDFHVRMDGLPKKNSSHIQKVLKNHEKKGNIKFDGHSDKGAFFKAKHDHVIDSIHREIKGHGGSADRMDESVQLGEASLKVKIAAAASAANALEKYAKTSGGVDKKDFMKIVHHLNTYTTGVPEIKKLLKSMDSDPRDYVIDLLMKHKVMNSTEAEKITESVELDEAFILEALDSLEEETVELTEKAFSAAISDKDYQLIRQASMRGRFDHKFSKTGGTVKFSTNRPNALAKDLEALIDSGASSWNEILGIDESVDLEEGVSKSVKDKQKKLRDDQIELLTGMLKTSSPSQRKKIQVEIDKWKKLGESVDLEEAIDSAYKRDFKAKEMDHELGHEKEPKRAKYSVSINGKHWKHFDSAHAATKATSTLKAKGRKATMKYHG